MTKTYSILLIFLTMTISACGLSGGDQTASSSPTPVEVSTGFSPSKTLTPPPATETFTPIPTSTITPTPPPTETVTPSPIPMVESLKAKVTAELLSCRYGPGAEYLYLYALRQTANITLIGRADGNNWVWVDGTNKCWVNSRFLDIQGDPMSLPIVYPGIAKLPVSPYYPPPKWAKATRKGNSVVITWDPVPISPGKYEDENMHQYLVEVWRCENGQILFETLGTNFAFITVENDEPGCNVPSRGYVYVQEKHGFAGPLEIPWPPH